jgi:AAA domain
VDWRQTGAIQPKKEPICIGGEIEGRGIKMTRDKAFETLRSVLTRLAATDGRSVPGSRVKTEVVARVEANGGRFDERSLGYGSFRAFLLGSGIVTVTDQPGSDILVSLSESGTLTGISSNSTDRRTSSGRPVREDFWGAFVTFPFPRQIRAYDRMHDRVVIGPAAIIPPAAIVIEPISKQTQLDWRRAFVSSHDPDSPLGGLREKLTFTEGFGLFKRELDSDPRLRKQWNSYWVDRVREVIQEWAEGHGIPAEVWTGKEVEPERRAAESSVTREGADLSTSEGGGDLQAVVETLSVDGSPEPAYDSLWEERSSVEWSEAAIRWLSTRFVTDHDGEVAISPRDSLTRALEFYGEQDYSAAVATLRPHIGMFLQQARLVGLSTGERRLIATCCLAEAELAALRNQWELGADLVLLGLEISPMGYASIADPWRYGQMLVGAHLGGGALELGPEEVARRSSVALLRCLAVGAGRAGAIAEELGEAVLGGRSPLYFSVREAVTRLLAEEIRSGQVTKRPRELEYEAYRTLADVTGTFRRRAEQLRNMLMESVGEPMKVHAETLVAHFGRHKPLLLADEEAAWHAWQPLMTRELSKYVALASGAAGTQRDAVAWQATYAHALSQDADRQRKAGLLSSIILLPATTHVASLVGSSLRDATQRQRPELQMSKSKRRFPLQRTDRDLSIPVEIQNVGPGAATSVTLELGSLPDGVEPRANSVEYGSIPSGQAETRSLFMVIAAPLRTLRIPVEIRGKDMFGGEWTSRDEVVVEDQTGDPDWDLLLARAPYSLQPVEELEKLRGRSAQLTKLRINLATRTSTIVWGQKRVGKTSMVRVFVHEIGQRQDVIALYVRKGDLAGFDEGGVGRNLAERLLDQCRERGLLTREVELPSPADFGGRLARLTRVVEQIRQSGVDKVMLVVLDEVDELNPAFYRGQRGEAFFATLRALGEQGVVFVLVGSERMPLVFRRYGQLLNRYETCELDTIESAQDVLEMVREPLAGFIEFGSDAIPLIARRSGGNPYYINLVCMRVLHAMVASRRTYVDAVDVNGAARSLAEDRSPTHWSHLWEDGDFEEDESAARQRQAALVLAAFGREPVERGLRAKEVEAALKEDCDGELPEGLNVEDTLEALVRRGVLRGEGTGAVRQYNVKFEIFRWWLCENGRAQLLAPFKERVAAGVEEENRAAGRIGVVGADFPISDDELIRVAEGLVYRDKQVHPMQIKQWLRQFQDDTKIHLAFRMLSALRQRWYFDSVRVSLLRERAFKRGLELASRAGVIPSAGRAERAAGEARRFTNEGLRRESFKTIVTNIFIGYFGDDVKSGAEVARQIKKENRISSAGNVRRAADWLERGSGTEHRDRFVLFVDDFIGSGLQAGGLARGFLKTYGDRPKVREALDQQRVAFVSLLAYRDGLANLTDEVGDALVVEAVEELDETDQAFAPEAEIFEAEDDRSIAEAMCREIGSQLYPDYPLGWEDLQSLVVFADSVPNATLPMFWRPGTVEGKPWGALFDR